MSQSNENELLKMVIETQASRIKEQEATIRELRIMVDELRSLKANLEETLEEFRRQFFGVSSEKTSAKAKLNDESESCEEKELNEEEQENSCETKKERKDRKDKEISKLKEENQKLKDEISELKNAMLKVKAEEINFKKYLEEDKAKMIAYANQRVLEKFVNHIDLFDKVVSYKPEDPA